MWFAVLGRLEVCRADGRPLPMPGPARRRLLAALLCRRGAVVSTRTLLDDLWGAAAPRSAVSSLHSHVARLRDDLGREEAGRARSPRVTVTGSPSTATTSTPAGSSGWPRGSPGSPDHRLRASIVTTAPCRCGATRRTSSSETRRSPFRSGSGWPSCARLPAERRTDVALAVRSRGRGGRRPRGAGPGRAVPRTGLGAARARAVPRRPAGRRPGGLPAGAQPAGRGPGRRARPGPA